MDEVSYKLDRFSELLQIGGDRDYFFIYRYFVLAIMIRALKDGLGSTGTPSAGVDRSRLVIDGQDYFDSASYFRMADMIGLNPEVKIQWKRGIAGAERWMQSVLSSRDEYRGKKWIWK